MDDLCIDLFGQVRARLNGRDLDLGSPQQRIILVWLALSGNQPVQRGELIDLLWGESPPHSVANVLQTYIKRLRQILEPERLARTASSRLPRVGGGYMLRVDPDAVDVLRFRRAVAAAAEARRRGAHAEVRKLLAEVVPLDDTAILAESPQVADHPRIRSLGAEYRQALEWDSDAALALGDVPAILSRLVEAVRLDPYDETAHARLMNAYRLVGRRTEAMVVYQDIRHRLAEDLGVDPGTKLTESYRMLLETVPEPVSAVKPAQLPARVGHFTGREQELAAVTRALRDGHDARLVLLTGPGGIGKTATALEAAHSVRPHFPDGQIFIDLRGEAGPAESLPAPAVLAYLLRSVGAPPDLVGGSVEEGLGWYRTFVEGRRLLLVFDNAGDADRISPLVPPSSDSAVIVTSRHDLSSLSTTHPLFQLTMGTLVPRDAITLISRVIGADRVNREQNAAADLVDVCGRYPLALRIVAAKLASRSKLSLRTLADDIAHDDARLSKLSLARDSRSIRSIFTTSYRSLTASAARAFRAVGVCRLPGFAVSLIAAMTDSSVAEAEEAVEELLSNHLVTEQSADHYTMHDLIRLFAGECARADETEAERAAMGERMLDWYLAVAGAAHQRLAKFRLDLDVPIPENVAVPAMPTITDALRVLDEERPDLLAVVRYAAEHRPSTAWWLSWLLDAYFGNRSYGGDSIEIGQLGLSAASRLGDPLAVALARGSLGRALVLVGRYAEALEHLLAAAEHHRHSGDQLLEAIASKDLALAHMNMRAFEAAITAYRRAADLFGSVGEPRMMAGMINNIAGAYNDLEQPQRARRELVTAFDTIDRYPDDRYLAAMLSTMGGSYKAEGDPAAADYFERSLRLHRKLGNRAMESEALQLLGETSERRDVRSAIEYYRDALEIERKLRNPHAIARVLQRIGTACRRLDRLDAARGYLEEALRIRRDVPYPYLEAQIHRELAEVADRDCRPADAVRHHAESDRLHGYGEQPVIRDGAGRSATPHRNGGDGRHAVIGRR